MRFLARTAPTNHKTTPETIPAEEYQRILERYLAIARKLGGPSKRVLKADAFNEAEGRPLPGGIGANMKGEVVCVEIRHDLAREAKAAGARCAVGDIRALPFADGRFDVVLDFSTVDHVQEWVGVLDEYARVLDERGTASVVTWTKSTLEYEETAFGQYYLPHEDFVHAFEERFEITERVTLYRGEHGGRIRSLIRLEGTVKPKR